MIITNRYKLSSFFSRLRVYCASKFLTITCKKSKRFALYSNETCGNALTIIFFQFQKTALIGYRINNVSNLIGVTSILRHDITKNFLITNRELTDRALKI